LIHFYKRPQNEIRVINSVRDLDLESSGENVSNSATADS